MILDGHHRFQICNELGIEAKFEVKEFPNALLEKKFVIEANLQRRHLNDFQKVELSLLLLEIETELAKPRQLSKLQFVRDNISLPSNEGNDETGEAVEIVAGKVGVSSTTYFRALTIIRKGSEELKQKVDSGQMSINYAYKMVKRHEEEEDFKPLPEGEFNVIYADPPWRYDLPFMGSPDAHYVTKTTEEISSLKIPSSEDAVLFLWATNPCLEDALTVMKAWGFRYKTNIVWIKDRAGTGYWVRGQHELLLIGIKGNMLTPLEENRPASVINAPRTNHSEKPEVVYEIIERMFPNGKYLELFARRKRKKWISWGMKIES